MDTNKKRVTLYCDCKAPGHILEIEVDPDSTDPTLYLWPKLNWHLPLGKRLVNALCYALHIRTGWTDFEELVITDSETAEKIRDACDEFITLVRRRVSKEVAHQRLVSLVADIHKSNRLLEEWSVRLSKRLGRPAAAIKKDGLTAYDFPEESVTLRFEDGSNVRFESAFALDNDKHVAVFTEHCGYHVFDQAGVVSVEILCQGEQEPPSERKP
jgi:hypothetical protein